MLKTTPCLVFLVLGMASVGPTMGDEKAAPRLDAKLRVKVDPATLQPSCQFHLSGNKDQSFSNQEYRYAVLDEDGMEVDGALIFRQPIRLIALPKDSRSVTDATDASFIRAKLKSGEEYFLVVSVRNLTGLARFMVP